MNERLIKILEGYEMHCASGEYEFIHRKDYPNLVKELLQAITVTPCCTELCECEDPFIEVLAEECSGCGMLIKGN